MAASNENFQLTIPVMSPELRDKINKFKADMRGKYKKISNETTPQVDGTGRKIVGKRPDGLDYIIEAYMRESLDKHFPGWSWKSAAPLQFLGSEWVVAPVELGVIDENLLVFTISPPISWFYGCGSARIQYKSGKPHVAENIIDIDKNVKAANSNALKVAINRLTHIGDDIYGKRIEEDGAGSLEDVVLASGDAISFGRWVSNNNILRSEVCQICEVSSPVEIQNFKEALLKIKKAKGMK